MLGATLDVAGTAVARQSSLSLLKTGKAFEPDADWCTVKARSPTVLFRVLSQRSSPAMGTSSGTWASLRNGADPRSSQLRVEGRIV